MELIIRADVLAGRARSAAREGARAFALACFLGPVLAREPVLLAKEPWDPHTPPPPVRLSVQHAPYPICRPRSWQFLAQHLAPLLEGRGMLWLGRGAEQGEFVGVVRIGGKLEPLTAVRLIGPGLERATAVDFPEMRTPSPGDEARWSRHIGALDRDTWLRQRSLRVAVVGAGRTGSVVAATLARWGTPLTLIDPDTVEAHNLDASECLLPADIGRPKAEALAAHLLRPGTGAPVDAITASVDSPAGHAALANAEVVVCCVDNDAARGFVGTWARRFGLVLLDIGTGVYREEEHWRAGADVRLILPGNGCLRCGGGLADVREHGPSAVWRQERAGSLRTLNQTAAHLGLMVLEQYVFGQLANSTWLRIEVGEAGIPAVSTIRPAQRPECAGCTETFRGRYRANMGADRND